MVCLCVGVFIFLLCSFCLPSMFVCCIMCLRACILLETKGRDFRRNARCQVGTTMGVLSVLLAQSHAFILLAHASSSRAGSSLCPDCVNFDWVTFIVILHLFLSYTRPFMCSTSFPFNSHPLTFLFPSFPLSFPLKTNQAHKASPPAARRHQGWVWGTLLPVVLLLLG